jgi:hypothetical protein
LYEYLAAGLSVVSTGLPSVKSIQSQYGQDVTVVEPKLIGDAVVAHLTNALEAKDLSRRLDFAESNSWTRRFIEIDDLLSSLGVTKFSPK